MAVAGGETATGGEEDGGMLSEETVVATFRAILGRAPETAAVLEHHRRIGSEAALRRALIRSPEFAAHYARLEAEALLGRLAAAALAEDGLNGAARHADERPGTVPLLLARGILPPPNAVETAAGTHGAALWERIAETWAALGTSAPHWSVITHEAFRPDRIEDNRADFEASAEVEGVLVDAALERVPGADPAAMRCLEIGCGVGRATRALARRFAHVTGADISPAHLAVAERELAALGLANVTLAHVARVEDYGPLAAGQDFVFSRLVLQHNPPPVQAAILGAVFAGLAPGGVVLVQCLTYARHYRYSAEADAGARPGGMEMHVLPQPAVFALMAEAGIAPLEVQEDFAAGRDGPFRSHLFLGRKS